MKTILIIALALIMLGCGEDDMAHIGEEITSDLVDTNVTDDTQEYDTTGLTVVSRIGRSSFIVKNGVLWSVGYNGDAKLGLGDTTNRNSFTNTGVTDVKSVFCGEHNTFIIKEDGTLWGVGNNLFGALGLGDETLRNTFVLIDIQNVKTVSTGSRHTFIIKTDGSLFATGWNGNGQLGTSDNLDRNTFTDTGITDVVSVSCGGSFTMIVKSNSTILGTGINNYGQLGVSDTSDRNVFTLATTPMNIRYISCGVNHTIAVDNSGSLFGTGHNLTGALGLGDNTNRNVFTDTGITDSKNGIVQGGLGFTFIIKTNGSLWSTGSNTQGELGLGDNSNRNSFTDTGFTNVKSVNVGREHTLIVDSANTLRATGRNTEGALGLGDNTNRNVFTDTSETPDTYTPETWSYFYQSDIVRIGDYRYLVALPTSETPDIFTSLTQIGAINQLKPFDNQNITPAIFASPMTYTIEGIKEFNAFTLAKVLATSITYTFRDELANIVKAATATIDVSRDKDGILSDYPTTVVFYADTQIAAGGTVEISLTYSDDIELGDFTLNNMVDSGFTNLAFSHAIKDFNDYTPDAWGNIPESVKAIVTTFNVSMDVPLTNYDYAVSFNESIAGKNVTIDASDSNGEVANGSTIFGSLIRRVRITNPAMKSNVKDGDLGKMATLTMKAQEIA